jgi:hypothetical protein
LQGFLLKRHSGRKLRGGEADLQAGYPPPPEAGWVPSHGFSEPIAWEEGRKTMNKDNVLNVMEQSEEKTARFLQAWKRGVEFLGPHLFGPGSVRSARDKDALQPIRKRVEAEIAKESGGEEQFLAAMVSFFDPAWGEELAARIDCYKSVCGLTYNFDHERMDILCELLRNYQGW